jgi:hypothetical protein
MIDLKAGRAVDCRDLSFDALGYLPNNYSATWNATDAYCVLFLEPDVGSKRKAATDAPDQEDDGAVSASPKKKTSKRKKKKKKTEEAKPKPEPEASQTGTTKEDNPKEKEEAPAEEPQPMEIEQDVQADEEELFAVPERPKRSSRKRKSKK